MSRQLWRDGQPCDWIIETGTRSVVTQYERDRVKRRGEDRAWMAAGAWVVCVLVAAVVLAVIP